MTVEHLNPLFAFETKDLSMLHCSSFLQYENMLISQLCYALHLKKKIKSWYMATSYVVAGLQSQYLAK